MFRWGRVLGIFSLFITSVPSFRLRVAFFFLLFLAASILFCRAYGVDFVLVVVRRNVE